MHEPDMAVVPAGRYTLGVPVCEEAVLHKWHGPRIMQTERFMIAKTAVTVREFKQYAQARYGAVPEAFAHLPTHDDGLPAGGLSWLDAVGYVRWLRAQTGKPYRLPRSDEWEVAARGGLDGAMFPWGDDAPFGRCDAFSADRGIPLPVKSHAPNGYGLYDMAGSVWTWCSDLWVHHSPDEPAVNTPTGLDPDMNAVLRGGSFMTAEPAYLMCAYVHEDPPDLRHPCLGMRLACDATKALQ